MSIKTWQDRWNSGIPRDTAMQAEIDDLRAEIDRLNSGWYDKLLKATLERDALDEQLTVQAHRVAHWIEKHDALKADAERYQWWVNTMTSEDALNIISAAFQHLPPDTIPSKEQFAEVIDTAMKGKS